MVGKKKISLLLTILFISLGLYSSPSLGLSFGYRNSSYFTNSAELEAHIKNDNYYFGALTAFDDYIRLSSGYAFNPLNTFFIDLDAYYYHAYEPAVGMSHLSFTLGQDLEFSSFLLNYRIGIIGGLNYSMYSNDISYSLSPNIKIETGFKVNDTFYLLAYLAGALPYETSFQSIPIVGLKGKVNIKRHSILFNSYIVFSDYMEGPDIILKDIVVRLGYEVEL